MSYSVKEEQWNAYSHGAGILLGIMALILLLTFDTHKTSYSTFSILIYAFSLIILYSASTVYHAIMSEKWKPILQKIDHICIYLLIAGTYTPVALISLESGLGWTIFWIVWSFAALGMTLKIFFTGRFELISVVLYLAMGWLIVIDLSSVLEMHSNTGIWLLALGGAFYTFGILFYAIQRIPYNHAIWHFFVLAGSIFHFFFILLDVI
ncbi:PAQR family membrane homeostasis protein TrhA [Altibacter sp. HG106]|uniref:PAQR family membrane homeostasis protein TrhA n=1 Tax=Altibacter sp. HG106 TaxID=3023937 RepID=UPI002350E080|nr:hemolysin III family protein [Altibacter sp. HG106]MDC7996167.1 hemolysin III family protein [Altibacter sp. HG106]